MSNFQTAANPAALVDYMVNGYWPDQGTPNFRPPMAAGNVIDVNLTALSARSAATARAALEAWEAVANVNFREVRTGGAITFDDAGSSATTEIRFTGDRQVSSIHLNIGEGWLNANDSVVGSFGFMTYMHEIGHILGLGHPGDYNSSNPTWPTGVQSPLDSYQYTIMSYYGQNENPNTDATRASAITPQLADIMAIQQIYGDRSGGATAGNTVWGRNATLDNYLGAYQRAGYNLGQILPYGTTFTLWDEGGRDLVDMSHHGLAQVVNLMPGGISSVLGLIGNMIITHDTLIENYNAGYGSDRINGNAVANRIDASGGNDTVWGNAGNDTLLGDLGNDTLRGGAGDDSIAGEAGNDTLYGEGGNDLMTGGTQNDILRGDDGNDSLTGDEGIDTLFGGTGHDRLAGGLLDDVLQGDEGNDRLWGDEGADRLLGGDGHDWLSGGLLDDLLQGDGGNDTLLGDEGNDRLLGGIGEDRLFGGDAHDQLDGGAGNDSLDGGLGVDTLTGGEGNDVLAGGDSGDILQGEEGNDRLAGEEGNDTLEGGTGHDTLAGDGGMDVLRGGAGRDWLSGGLGHDTLAGGDGPDTFVFDSGRDRITDFAAGDRILLDAALWGGTAPGRATVMGQLKDTADGLELIINLQNRLLLEGVHDQKLFADAFDFV